MLLAYSCLEKGGGGGAMSMVIIQSFIQRVSSMESAKEDAQDAGVENPKRTEDATDATPMGLSAIFDRKPVEPRAALPQPAPVNYVI
jgi:hypothetical protein